MSFGSRQDLINLHYTEYFRTHLYHALPEHSSSLPVDTLLVAQHARCIEKLGCVATVNVTENATSTIVPPAKMALRHGQNLSLCGPECREHSPQVGMTRLRIYVS